MNFDKIKNLSELSLTDIIRAEYVKTVWEANNIYETDPDLGEALFPAEQTARRDVTTILGKDRMPRMLEPSAYDTKPSMRDRIGFAEIKHDMMFFREGRRLGEEEAMEINRILKFGEPKMAELAVKKVYDDLAQLIMGGRKRIEQMRMQMLINARIRVVGKAENGRTAQMDIVYDYDGEWAKNNNIVVSGTDQWTPENAKTAKPMQTLVNLIDNIGATTGKRPTNLYLNSKTFNDMLTADEIRTFFTPIYGDNMVLSLEMKKQKFQEQTGITPIIYDKMYENDMAKIVKYIPDGIAILSPDGALGKTYFGENPEDVFYGSLPSNKSVSRVGEGYTVLTTTEVIPPSVMGTVSATMLPSYDNMNEVYIIKQEYAVEADEYGLGGKAKADTEEEIGAGE